MLNRSNTLKSEKRHSSNWSMSGFEKKFPHWHFEDNFTSYYTYLQRRHLRKELNMTSSSNEMFQIKTVLILFILKRKGYF